jgi:hypothetical protein
MSGVKKKEELNKRKKKKLVPHVMGSAPPDGCER